MCAGSDVPPAHPQDTDVSFNHLFELARELSISLDRGGRHSSIDHHVVMVLTDDTAPERTSFDRRPVSINFRTQRAGEGDPRLQRAFTDREAAAPPADAISPTRAVQGGFDQCPPQPW